MYPQRPHRTHLRYFLLRASSQTITTWHLPSIKIYAHALLCQTLRVALPPAIVQRGGIWLGGIGTVGQHGESSAAERHSGVAQHRLLK